ncbi:MAG: hypothetical protein HC909_03145 [Blastochloris sp.]|nr:hypothetical protein [Blastochloris sp.]
MIADDCEGAPSAPQRAAPSPSPPHLSVLTGKRSDRACAAANLLRTMLTGIFADRASAMVKSGGFIVGVASALDLPEATISGAFRVLRESGLMTSGARGVNAPDMTYLDAARMLIAMLVSERPAYAECSVRDFGQLICLEFTPASMRLEMLPELTGEQRAEFTRMSADFTLNGRGLPERHTFEQAVSELIRMYSEDINEDYWLRSQLDVGERGKFDPNTRIEVVPGLLEARIEMQGNIYEYCDALIDPKRWGEDESPEGIQADLDAEEAHDLKRSRYSTAIRSVRSVDTIRIAALASIISGEKE